MILQASLPFSPSSASAELAVEPVVSQVFAHPELLQKEREVEPRQYLSIEFSSVFLTANTPPIITLTLGTTSFSASCIVSLIYVSKSMVSIPSLAHLQGSDHTQTVPVTESQSGYILFFFLSVPLS